MRSEVLQVRLSLEERQRLDEAAELLGMTRADVLRRGTAALLLWIRPETLSAPSASAMALEP